MAALKREAAPRDAKPRHAHSSPLARVMRDFEQLVDRFETGLLRSLDDAKDATALQLKARRSDDIRREACRLAISDLSNQYACKHIRRSLNQAESEGKRVEEQLHTLSLAGSPAHDDHLASLHNGYFRLYSTELFDLLGQPTELRLGTLRFHKHRATHAPQEHPPSPWVTVELALNHAFFVADSMETLPYHTFRLPTAPSLQNRGILSRKPQDGGAFPDFDSWLLFTFLGNGCIKLEVPIEMCADVYGGRLRGRENEEVLFWGFFVDDDVE
ncbi:Nn.00g101290.m01.CDS01 [Neocucurbitaria sp. VM-36]